MLDMKYVNRLCLKDSFWCLASHVEPTGLHADNKSTAEDIARHNA